MERDDLVESDFVGAGVFGFDGGRTSTARVTASRMPAAMNCATLVLTILNGKKALLWELAVCSRNSLISFW